MAKSQPLQFIKSRRSLAGLLVLTAVGALLRIKDLQILPPGLSGGEASIGNAALALIHHGTVPGFTAQTAYAPLWIALQALPVWLIGHTAMALRLWPVIIGISSILAVWLWARDWFDEPVAWVAAFLIAVTPWSVTLSRSASPAILATLLLPAVLFVGARAVTRGAARWWWLSLVFYAIGLVSGPLGWAVDLLAVVLLVVGGWPKRRAIVHRHSVATIIAALVLQLGLIALAVINATQLRGILHDAGVVWQPATIGATFLKVLGMFNVHGDDNFLHNFNGEPLFNAFVGLMLIAGVLVTLTRLKQRRYLGLLIGLVVTLLPALISPVGAPNAARSAAALPLAVVLASVGVGYMLELWYTTFPINAAARSTGLAAILFLLGLTVFQGYVQVFRAWSGSAETYQAYDEAGVNGARYLSSHKFSGQRYLISSPQERTVVAYLAYGANYGAIDPKGLVALPLGTGAHQFVITAAVRNETARNLATKFPGGKLAPHYSSFSQNELYYDYETTQ